MKNRFSAQLADKSFINVPADRIYREDNMIYVYNGEELMAAVDISVVLCARLDKEVSN